LLTAKGKDECLQLREEFPFSKEISIVLASPLRRTIQTAAWVFAPELEQRQLPFILVPGAQEISGFNCNHGWDEDRVKSQAPTLVAEVVPDFESSQLDTSLVDESWNSKVFTGTDCGIDCTNVNPSHRLGYMPTRFLLSVNALPTCGDGFGIVLKNILPL
jgi:hypothetical protein